MFPLTKKCLAVCALMRLARQQLTQVVYENLLVPCSAILHACISHRAKFTPNVSQRSSVVRLVRLVRLDLCHCAERLAGNLGTDLLETGATQLFTCLGSLPIKVFQTNNFLTVSVHREQTAVTASQPHERSLTVAIQ